MNCSDFDVNDNVTIRCYTFASGITYGAAVVGGLLTSTTYTIALLGKLLTLASDKEICCSHFKKIVSFITAISPWIIAIAMIALITSVPFSSKNSTVILCNLLFT